MSKCKIRVTLIDESNEPKYYSEFDVDRQEMIDDDLPTQRHDNLRQALRAIETTVFEKERQAVFEKKCRLSGIKF